MEGRKRAPEQLGRVLVLGLGVSGTAAARYCKALLGGRVERLVVAAGARTEAAEALAAELEAAGARVYFDSEDVDECFDLCIASPGISQFSDFYQAGARASAEIVSEVEFAWRESAADSTWIAITGTNGKTTTTALTAHLMRQAGFAAAAVGNIGDTCIEAVASGEVRCYVAEVSSYQLASTVHFAPDVAVVLGITPDHLAWHRTHEAYVAAKYRVLANLGPDGVAVLDATNDTVRAKVRELRAAAEAGAGAADAGLLAGGAQGGVRRHGDSACAAHAAPEGSLAHTESPDGAQRLGGGQGAAADARRFSYVPVGTVDGIGGDMRGRCGARNAAFRRGDGVLVVALDGAEHELVPASELLIPGAHNVGNALCAASAALAAGAAPEAVREGLRTFASLPHRIEACGSVGGVACYNDSKATNVDATLAALAAFDPKRPIVLLGGDDKGTDLAPLVTAAREHCKAVVLYGASHDRFAEAFSGGTGNALTSGHWPKPTPSGSSRPPHSPEKASTETGGTGNALTSGHWPKPTPSGSSRPPHSPEKASAETDGTDDAGGAGHAGDALVVLNARQMADAFQAALGAAVEGDIVLLSPACASFDEFSSYRQRGDVFKQLVADAAQAAAVAAIEPAAG